MRFRVQLAPTDIERLPEPVHSQILEQLPREVERERQRLVRFRDRLEHLEQENKQWSDYLDFQAPTVQRVVKRA